MESASERAERRAREVADGKLTARKATREEFDQDREAIAYWLSRPVQERFAAVEILRRQRHGDDYSKDCRLRGPNALVVKLVRKPRTESPDQFPNNDDTAPS